MAENKNIIIGLLVLAVIILLAFIAFRPMMYGSTYNPSGYQSGHMGPGMMNNSGYNYSYGPGMMGNTMGDMMALYYPGSKPITQDEAIKNMKSFAQQYGPEMELEDLMAFSSN